MPQETLPDTDIFAILDQASEKTNALLQEAKQDGRIEDFRLKFTQDFNRRILEQFQGVSLTGEEKKKLSDDAAASIETSLEAIKGRGLSEGEVRPRVEQRTQERLTQRIGRLQQFARQTRGKLALDAASNLLRGGRLEKRVAQQEQQLMLDAITRWDELQMQERLGLSKIEIETAFNEGQLDNRKMAISLERVATILGFQVQREEIAAQLDALEAENSARWNQVIQSGAALAVKLAMLL